MKVFAGILPAIVCCVAFVHAASEEETGGVSYNAARDGFVVHEWGVFRRVAGGTGSNASGNEGLPDFIKWEEVQLDRGNMVFEKPVLYFYAPGKQEVDVQVTSSYTGGKFCQWPPRLAGEQEKQAEKRVRRGVSFDWNRLTVHGEGNAKLKTVDAGHWWSKARQPRSALVQSGGEAEKFLFYELSGASAAQPLWLKTEGRTTRLITRQEVSGDATPEEIAERKKMIKKSRGAQAQGESQEWELSRQCTHLFLIHVAGGQGQIVYAKEAAKEGDALSADWSRVAASKTGDEEWAGRGREQFKKALVESGLYDDEAGAIADIWDKDFFKTDGTRAVYLLPQSEYDKMFPITLSVKPKSMVRVMIVAVE